MQKYRTVAIPLELFEELKNISETEGRSYARQIAWMIKNYRKNNSVYRLDDLFSDNPYCWITKVTRTKKNR